MPANHSRVPGTEAEADGVDRILGEVVEHPFLEIGVRGRIVGLGRRAVPEQVDTDRVTADVAEQVDPAVVHPRLLERGTETVQERHWWTRHRPVAYWAVLVPTGTPRGWTGPLPCHVAPRAVARQKASHEPIHRCPRGETRTSSSSAPGRPASPRPTSWSTRYGITSTVLESDSVVGGISRTVERDGWRFDIGGHRFFTKVKEVEAFWHEILPDEDFMLRPRMSRIFYEGKYYDYPLKAFERAAATSASGRRSSA